MLNLKFMKIGSPSLISSSLRFEWYDIKKSILARKSFANPAVLCLNRFICSWNVSLFPSQLTRGNFLILIILTSDGIDGVEGAKDGRAGGAVDEEGQAALRLVLQHALLELLRDHTAPVEQKFVFILSLGVFCVY